LTGIRTSSSTTSGCSRRIAAKRFLAVGGFGDDVHVAGEREQRSNALPDERLIVDEHETDHDVR
jgi:hypothetical protein